MNWEMNRFYREEGGNTFPLIDVGKHSCSDLREGGGGMILNRTYRVFLSQPIRATPSFLFFLKDSHLLVFT